MTTQGQMGRELGVLLDGSTTVEIDGEVVATLEKGDHFGEMALLDAAGATGRTRLATVTADTDLSIAEFETMLALLPDIAVRLRRSAAVRRAE